MSKTIHGVPEFLTREQWVNMFRQYGFTPELTKELTFTHDGVRAVVFDVDEHGRKHLDLDGSGYAKHRVFIPVRDDVKDEQTTQVAPYITRTTFSEGADL